MRVIVLVRDEEEEISMDFCHLSSALWSGNWMRSVLTLSTAGLPNRSIGRQGQRKGTPEIVSCLEAVACASRRSRPCACNYSLPSVDSNTA